MDLRVAKAGSILGNGPQPGPAPIQREALAGRSPQLNADPIKCKGLQKECSHSTGVASSFGLLPEIGARPG